jgi:hypothetical protein
MTCQTKNKSNTKTKPNQINNQSNKQSKRGSLKNAGIWEKAESCQGVGIHVPQ